MNRAKWRAQLFSKLYPTKATLSEWRWEIIGENDVPTFEARLLRDAPTYWSWLWRVTHKEGSSYVQSGAMGIKSRQLAMHELEESIRTHFRRSKLLVDALENLVLTTKPTRRRKRKR